MSLWMGGVSVQLTIKAASPVEVGPNRKDVWGEVQNLEVADST